MLMLLVLWHLQPQLLHIGVVSKSIYFMHRNKLTYNYQRFSPILNSTKGEPETKWEDKKNTHTQEKIKTKKTNGRKIGWIARNWHTYKYIYICMWAFSSSSNTFREFMCLCTGILVRILSPYLWCWWKSQWC